MKEHSHDYTFTNLSYQQGDALIMGGSNLKIMTSAGTTTKAGSGNVNRGKRKAVIYIIKAL